MVFVLELCVAKAGLNADQYPVIMSYLRRLQNRPAYRHACDRIANETDAPYQSVEAL